MEIIRICPKIRNKTITKHTEMRCTPQLTHVPYEITEVTETYGTCQGEACPCFHKATGTCNALY